MQNISGKRTADTNVRNGRLRIILQFSQELYVFFGLKSAWRTYKRVGIALLYVGDC